MIQLECKDLENILRQWEKTGEIPFDISCLREHINLCSSCRNKYKYLFPLLARDMEITRKPKDTPVSEERVKEILAGLTAKRLHSFPWLAAAAVVLVITGLLFTARFIIPERNTDTITLRFVLSAPEAREVSITGDFTKWDPKGIPLKRKEAGIWEVKVKLEKGIYMYNFIIDGEYWITDPASSVDVDDGFGGKNSMIKI